jgi:two-component system, OmpR family, phosphate regulon sensor histidine kinase PhoR
MNSIMGRAAALMGLSAVPLVVVVELYGPPGYVRLFALAWGILAICGAWLFSRSVARRIKDLRAFADRFPEPGDPLPRLNIGDDDLGELERSLSRMAPKIEVMLKNLDAELARRETILGSMTEAVLAVDAKLNISFCNNSFIRAAGDHGISEGVPLIKVLRDPGLLQLLKRVIQSGETVQQRLKLSSQDRAYAVYAAPLDALPSRGALAILHDVTPIERLERTKRDFVANVSHEFRTPLATIAGYAETLLNGGLEDRENRRRFVEVIQANSVRLNNIATDLIILSELESGQLHVEPAPIPVADVIHSAISAIEPVARVNQVLVEAEPESDLEVMGHRIRFEQALLNLLDNAVKFNKPGGRVDIKAAVSSNNQVEICIGDTGIGIPAEDLSRIFERFYRVDKARSRQVGGTGLGLSIVRHAIEQMQGAVKVESQLGKGSRFTITLPRYHRA